MIPCSEEEYFYKIDNLLLSSCHQIRALVRKRWKKETGKEWVDGKTQGAEFIKVFPQMCKQSRPIQKEMIGKGCLGDWDLTMLGKVLQNCGDVKVNKSENEAICSLTRMRNGLAHHPTKKLSVEEYDEKVVILRRSFLAIGLTESDIEKAIAKAGITSSLLAQESVTKLYVKASSHEEKGEFEAAVESYTDAISMPSLLPVSQGVAYENRASCYLKMYALQSESSESEEDREQLREQALLDAKQALELNENSWKAHYLYAQVHRLKSNFSDAIHHYHQALSISPVQKQVKKDLDTCKILSTSQDDHDHLHPDGMPISLSEIMAHFEKETGMHLTEEQYLGLMNNFTGVVWKGQDHVFRGHQYYHGWRVSQDHAEAARHYAKAALVGNAEGIYNSGVCYFLGKGVVQDPEIAFQYFKEAAEMSADTAGGTNSLNKNYGVAAAQHSLGLMYENGIYVEQDFIKAVDWYSKACGNGNGGAANNLGRLYLQGRGVQKNEKKAEMYLNQGVMYKDVNAAGTLMKFYITHLEPEKALVLYKTGKELGHPGLVHLKKKDLDSMLLPAKLKREKSEKALIDFEKEHNLDIRGLTYLERLKRQFSLQSVFHKDFLQLLQQTNSEKNWETEIHHSKFADPDVIKCIAEKAAQGSVTAENILETVKYNLEIIKILNLEEEITAENEEKIVDLLYKCATLDCHAIVMPMPRKCADNMKTIIGGLFEKSESKGEFDMKIRFCFVYFNLFGSMKSEDTFGLELLKEGIRRYPDNPFYYERLAELFAIKKNFKSALRSATEGLSLSPENVSMLHTKAVCVHLIICNDSDEFDDVWSEGRHEIIIAYEEFLKKAPSDHRKVPEAYYILGFQYMVKMKADNLEKSEIMEKLEYYFNEGLKAEKDQLPCYLPYQCSEHKSVIKMMIDVRNEVYLSKENNEALAQDINVNRRKNTAKILELKPYLNEQVRKVLHVEHRKKFASWSESKSNSSPGITLTPCLKQTCAKKLSRLKPIALKEMNQTEDHIYEGCALDLTIIEDACLGNPSIHLLAEDENGDVTRLYIYNEKQNLETHEKFSFGNRIGIINPYMRIDGNANTNGIRNDEPKCIVHLEKVVSMCRFCGEGQALRKCSKCECSYCSRECQELDWKMFKHKLICSIKVDALKGSRANMSHSPGTINPTDFNNIFSKT